MHAAPYRPRSLEERLAIANAIRRGRAPPADADGYGDACAQVFGQTEAPEATDRPLVSILICTYNRAQWLAEAVDSALNQRWPVEVVVVDDGSTDDTPAVLAAYGARVRAHRHARNSGKPAALNTGIADLRGAAYLVLDDDDKLLFLS